MKPGSGKSKGSAFEREISKYLSLWVSAGAREDFFARSSMSGGRATLLHRKGKIGESVAGDICAVHADGHPLISHIFVECKNVKSMGFQSFCLQNKGLLANFWATAQEEAEKHGKVPWLIVKENRGPTLLITSNTSTLERTTGGVPIVVIPNRCKIFAFEAIMCTSYDEYGREL